VLSLFGPGLWREYEGPERPDVLKVGEGSRQPGDRPGFNHASKSSPIASPEFLSLTPDRTVMNRTPALRWRNVDVSPQRIRVSPLRIRGNIRPCRLVAHYQPVSRVLVFRMSPGSESMKRIQLRCATDADRGALRPDTSAWKR
jgi:hypothetical protein